MGLGTGFESIDGSEATEAKRERRPRIGLRKEPTMPRPTPAPEEPVTGAEHEAPAAGISTVTAWLCAAAYLRYDHAGVVARACSRFVAVAPRALWIVLTSRGVKREQALKKLTKTFKREDRQPQILLGHEYAAWVRRRIASGHPVPPHGFHPTPILHTAAASEGLTHFRRILLLSAAAGAVAVGVSLGFPAALCAAVGSAWLACYTDRLCARLCLRSERWATRRSGTGLLWWVGRKRRRDLRRGPRDGRVAPYTLNLRKYRSPTHSMVGAGNLWSEHAIGIDVAPSVSAEAQQRETEEERLVRQAFRSVQDIVIGGGDGFEQFTPDQLHRHVAEELNKLRDPHPEHQPENRLDVFDVAAVSAESWEKIDADEWAALLTLAQEGTGAKGAARDSQRARRMLCTRIVSWEGDLVTCLYIGFAYEHHFLRITVRPHVLNPVNTRLTEGVEAAQSTGVGRELREALNAFLDLFALVGQLRRPFTRPRPDQDDTDPASLREAYSCRYMDDMLQYDDARRHVSWMERCVFRAVLDFLKSRNVDVSAFLNQATYILQNSGVVNTGNMSNVQNQPGSHHSTATMNTSPSPEGGA